MDMKDCYEKNIAKKCDVCSRIVMIDQYGNGRCEHCGWINDKYALNNQDRVCYPNMISLNKAKSLYKDGEALLPSFEDFLEALFVFSEMVFTYHGKEYEVFLTGANDNDIIVLATEGFRQDFCSKKEFFEKATVDGVLLRDIWSGVTNADYMG